MSCKVSVARRAIPKVSLRCAKAARREFLYTSGYNINVQCHVERAARMTWNQQLCVVAVVHYRNCAVLIVYHVLDNEMPDMSFPDSGIFAVHLFAYSIRIFRKLVEELYEPLVGQRIFLYHLSEPFPYAISQVHLVGHLCTFIISSKRRLRVLLRTCTCAPFQS